MGVSFKDDGSTYSKRIVLSINYIMEEIESGVSIELQDILGNVIFLDKTDNLYSLRIFNIDDQPYKLVVDSPYFIKSQLVIFMYLGFVRRREDT